MAGWGKVYEFVLPEFSGGVHASANPDLIPPNSSPRAMNCSFEQIGDGTAIVRKRRGFRPLNTTSFGQSIIGQHFYRRWDDSTGYENFHLLVGEGGLLGRLNNDNSITTTSSATINGVVEFFSAITANNDAYLAVGVPITVGSARGNGLKYDGTTWSLLGITAPDPVGVATPTGTGDMDGTYDVAISYKNSSSGHQSSRSTSTEVTLAGEKLFITWLQSPDPQVDQVVVHIRNQNISEVFYEAATYTASVGQATLDISLDDYNGFIVESPDQFSRQPLPDGTLSLAWFRERLLAATREGVYYSERDQPESFDPERFEPVASDDGQRVIAILAVFDMVLILKERSVYALMGDGPNDWVVRQMSPDIGCVAARSVVSADDKVMWWSVEGPVVWTGDGPPVRLGVGKINDLISTDTLNFSSFANVVAINDKRNHRFLFAVPEMGQLRNTAILPFNYQLGEFEGVWTTLDIASFCAGEDTIAQPWTFVGGYNGRVYKHWDADVDGVYSGTYSGTFSSTSSASVSTLSGSGFDTTVGLTGLYVHAVDSSGTYLPRRRVSSNDATTITLATPWLIDTSQTYTFYVGAIDFQFDTKWSDDGRPFHKKRLEFLYLQIQVPASTAIWLDKAYNLDESHVHTSSISLSPSTTGGIWDYSIWDSDLWSTVAPINKRIRMAHTGRVWKIRIRHLIPYVPLTIMKVGMRGEILTDKR